MRIKHSLDFEDHEPQTYTSLLFFLHFYLILKYIELYFRYLSSVILGNGLYNKAHKIQF